MVMEQGASWSGREKNCVYLNLADGRFANAHLHELFGSAA